MSSLDRKKKIIYFSIYGVRANKEDFFENSCDSDHIGYILFPFFIAC